MFERFLSSSDGATFVQGELAVAAAGAGITAEEPTAEEASSKEIFPDCGLAISRMGTRTRRMAMEKLLVWGSVSTGTTRSLN